MKPACQFQLIIISRIKMWWYSCNENWHSYKLVLVCVCGGHNKVRTLRSFIISSSFHSWDIERKHNTMHLRHTYVTRKLFMPTFTSLQPMYSKQTLLFRFITYCDNASILDTCQEFHRTMSISFTVTMIYIVLETSFGEGYYVKYQWEELIRCGERELHFWLCYCYKWVVMAYSWRLVLTE